MLVLEKDDPNFRAFNVGSDRPTTIVEYANAVLQKPPSSVDLKVSGEYRRGDNRNSVSSIEKLRSFGVAPAPRSVHRYG